jgi:hypothetical protein
MNGVRCDRQDDRPVGRVHYHCPSADQGQIKVSRLMPSLYSEQLSPPDRYKRPEPMVNAPPMVFIIPYNTNVITN